MVNENKNKLGMLCLLIVSLILMMSYSVSAVTLISDSQSEIPKMVMSHTSPYLEFRETDQAGTTGEFRLASVSGTIRMQSRNALDTDWENVAEWKSVQSGLQSYLQTPVRIEPVSPTVNKLLLQIYTNDASKSTGSFSITSASTNVDDYEVRLISPNPDIQFYESDQATPDGKFRINANSNSFHMQSRNAGDTGWEDVLNFTQKADGGNLIVAGDVNGASPTELSYLSGLSSNAQTQLNAITTKTNWVTVTQAVNLDTMESNIATNNGKISYTDGTKVGYITVTQAVDLDTIESDVTDLNANTAGYITDGNTNWDNSYGFVTTSDDTVSGTELNGLFSNGILVKNGDNTFSQITDNSTNWNTAYSWGNHASAGYLTSEVDGSTTNEIQNVVTGGGLVRDGSNNFGMLSTCSDAQVLKYNSTSGAWECENDNTGSGGTLTAVVDDTSPDLGGNLDGTNSYGLINIQDIEVQSNYPYIDLTESDQVAPAGMFELVVDGGEFKIKSRNSGDTSYQSIFDLKSVASQGISYFYTPLRMDLADNSLDEVFLQLENTNASHREGMLRINSAGTDGSDYDIRMDSPDPDIEFYETDTSGSAFEIVLSDGQLKIEGRNAGDTAFEPSVYFDMKKNGGGVGFCDDYPEASIGIGQCNTSVDYLRIGDGTVMKVDNSGTVSIGDLAGTYTGGSAYVCVNNAGEIYASEVACP